VIFSLIKQGDVITVQKKDNSDDYQTFNVSGAITVISNSYIKIPVSNTGSGGVGATNFSQNDTLLFVITSVGVQGPTGAQGVQGTVGAQGTVGSQGVQGTQGTQGVQGTIGAQGAQGTTGSQGVQGVQGTVGTGTQGTQGVQGTAGTTGTQGTAGTAAAGGSIPDILMLGGM
jgi:hypothetical protein